MKWIRGYGTKLVWNSVTSTLRAPSKRREAVKEEITCSRTKERKVFRVSEKFLQAKSKGERRAREEGNTYLSDQPVKVGVGWPLNVQGPSADIVDGLVIKHNSDVSVLKQRVSGQDRVVRLNNGGGDLWGWVDGESELGLLSVVNGKSLQKKRTETRSGTTSNSVEDQETLETSTVVSQLPDSVEAQVDNLLSDGVVTTGEVVGSIFLTGDQLLRVEQLSVGSGTDLINNSRLKIEENASWDMLSSSGFGEKGVEGIITTSDGLVRRHLTIRLNTVLEAVQLPASITNLDTGLSNMNGDNFTHLCFSKKSQK